MHYSGFSSAPGTRSLLLGCLLGLYFGFSPIQRAQVQTSAPDAKHNYSTEAFVIEDNDTRIAFEDDGNYRQESADRVRIQSDAGVQRYSVLTFPYESSVETLEIQYVRVRKPDGTIVTTPADMFQDMPAEITRQAPFYSDLREKHVPVKGLGVGDTLELKTVSICTKPLISGQFWTAYNFSHDSIVLRERLEIVVPRNRAIKWKSRAPEPAITEQAESRTFTWTTSHLQQQSEDQERKQKERLAYDSARGKNSPPDVQLSSFQNWGEIGRWYAGLQQDRSKATPEIRAKAEEITKGLADETSRTRAIYAFVSTQFRYIGVAFGIGRYQPHAATDVLSNGYGDCKDKHTLLAALLESIGVKAYPALISSSQEVDADVPSPGQFDHVISAIPVGDHFLWLDTTQELTPFGYLIGMLRDKKVLVITEGKPLLLANTPADPPTRGSQIFHIDAKLSDTGTLQGKVQRTLEGDDNALLVRAAFRSVPMPRWKDLVQQLSAISGFGGEVSEATASSPEKSDEPFRIEYTYTRKDFGDWPNHRIVAPLPFVTVPVVDDKNDKPSYPIWLGPAATIYSESHLELPKGYTPIIPIGVDLKEDFAEYHASHRFKDGVLISERQLVVKAKEVPVAEFDAYKKFSKAVSEDYGMFIALSSRNSAVIARLNPPWTLPASDNADAVAAFNEAVGAFQTRDAQRAIGLLKHAVELDPKFTRAWVALAQAYTGTGEPREAVNSYVKAIKGDPQQSLLYDGLGVLLGTYKPEEAISVWQNLLKSDPTNAKSLAGLGSSLYRAKRYTEAAAALQSAVDLTPELPEVQVRLGSAYLRAGDDQKALKAYGEALELDQSSWLLNEVSYELAEANKDLSEALQYAQKAVLQEEQATEDTDLTELDVEDLGHPGKLAAYWDTLGWVYFRTSNFDQAEKYLVSAWKLGQSGLIADHLGQVYERENKKQAAVRMYKIALHLYKSGIREDSEVVKTEARMERLTPGKSVTERYNFTEVFEDVNRTRTARLPRSVADDADAQFFLIFARDPETSSARVQAVKFINGSEELRAVDKAITAIKFDVSFPDDGPTLLLRRGILSCYKSAGCSMTLMNIGDVHSLN
jgi:tetratricopeptide (TPR) repeat protein